jgi:hypothetical protein
LWRRLTVSERERAVLSRQLGHARPSITLDIYARQFEAQGGDAVDEAISKAFEGVPLAASAGPRLA